ncbi:hypothetical protein C4D60_Mb06t34630 [Musa balbisiana]|uniref:Plastocyanin-like domain-containing protein n=1 Tax=Musa balbisiana TaxID=52838 RepID=A0A4S8ITL7_MUSBA|nr:hypothetical protein C4D60_Mb06t34630 [Musa balbisiana]
MKNVTQLCSTKPIVTVNGQFPGPTQSARQGDTVLVKVVNHVRYDVTIHWPRGEPLLHLRQREPSGGGHQQRDLRDAEPGALLQHQRVFTDDFLANPPVAYNYSGSSPRNVRTMSGTRLYRFRYNAMVQLVLQETGLISPENHPIHLHGFNFFAVGRGIGNYDPRASPSNFNLVDPVERNTIGVPSGGWTAIRFRVDNPGFWFLHCHLDVHTWGLKMAFIVDTREGPNESILPPPNTTNGGVGVLNHCALGTSKKGLGTHPPHLKQLCGRCVLTSLPRAKRGSMLDLFILVGGGGQQLTHLL